MPEDYIQLVESADHVLNLQGKTVIKIDLMPAGKSESYMSYRNMIFHSIHRSLDSLHTFFNFLMSEQKKYDYVGTEISFFPHFLFL